MLYDGKCLERSNKCLAIDLSVQELRSREEELNRAALQQKMQEEALRQREQELAEREIQLVERELNVMILQQGMSKPIPKKRNGKFRKSRLKLLRATGSKSISEPSGRPCPGINIHLQGPLLWRVAVRIATIYVCPLGIVRKRIFLLVADSLGLNDSFCTDMGPIQ